MFFTRYTTLSLDEYMNFAPVLDSWLSRTLFGVEVQRLKVSQAEVHAYMDLQSKEYESAFYQLDKDGSGTIEANHWHVQLAGTSAGAPQAGELSELLLSIGITPMDHAARLATPAGRCLASAAQRLREPRAQPR